MKWTQRELRVIDDMIECKASEIRDSGRLPNRCLRHIQSRLDASRRLAGIKPKRRLVARDVDNDRDLIAQMILREGITIDECAEKFDTTPARICQVMGWQ